MENDLICDRLMIEFNVSSSVCNILNIYVTDIYIYIYLRYRHIYIYVADIYIYVSSVCNIFNN